MRKEEWTLEELEEIERGKQRIAEIAESMRYHVSDDHYSEKEASQRLKLDLKELTYMSSQGRLDVRTQGVITPRIFYSMESVDKAYNTLRKVEVYSKNVKVLLLYGQDFFDTTLERSEAISFLNVNQLYFKNLLLNKKLKPFDNPLNIEVYRIQDLEDLIMMYGLENSQDEDLWATQKNAAALLGVSISAVVKKVWSGRLREYKHFGRPYYKISDLVIQETPDNLLTVGEVCSYLKINDISLTGLVFKGKLTETREGHRRYYDKTEVQRLYEEDKYWLNDNPDWMTTNEVLDYFRVERTALSGLVTIYKPIKVRNKYWFERSKICEDDLL